MKEQIDLAIKNEKVFFLGARLQDDWYQAFAEWSDIADKDNKAEAYFNMAYCYLTGNGVKANSNKAIELYEMAGSLGLQESYMNAYKAKAEHGHFKILRDYINYLHALKENGVWTIKPQDEKSAASNFSVEYQSLLFQENVIKLNGVSPNKRLSLAKELIKDATLHTIKYSLGGFIAVSEISATVEYRHNKVNYIEETGRVSKGNTVFRTRFKNKVEYLVRIKNNSPNVWAIFDLKLRSGDVDDILSASKKDPLYGVEKAYKELPRVMIEGGKEKIQKFEVNLPNKNLSNNIVDFIYNFWSDFDFAYKTNEFRGNIDYKVKTLPSVEVIKKLSESDKKNIIKYSIAGVIFFGFFIYSFF